MGITSQRIRWATTGTDPAVCRALHFTSEVTGHCYGFLRTMMRARRQRAYLPWSDATLKNVRPDNRAHSDKVSHPRPRSAAAECLPFDDVRRRLTTFNNDRRQWGARGDVARVAAAYGVTAPKDAHRENP